jgi:hypothetical protein
MIRALIHCIERRLIPLAKSKENSKTKGKKSAPEIRDLQEEYIKMFELAEELTPEENNMFLIDCMHALRSCREFPNPLDYKGMIRGLNE